MTNNAKQRSNILEISTFMQGRYWVLRPGLSCSAFEGLWQTFIENSRLLHVMRPCVLISCHHKGLFMLGRRLAPIGNSCCLISVPPNVSLWILCSRRLRRRSIWADGTFLPYRWIAQEMDHSGKRSHGTGKLYAMLQRGGWRSRKFSSGIVLILFHLAVRQPIAIFLER